MSVVSQDSHATDPLIVFGGSFDPPHMSHVMAAIYARAVLPDAELLMIPTFAHALGKNFSASFEERVAMCKLAVADIAGVSVSPLEAERGGLSRTLDTLEYLQDRFPGRPLRLLVGADILAEKDRWYRFDDIETIAPLLLVGRPGFVSNAPFTLPDIASRALRVKLLEGASVEGLVPQSVLSFIEEHKLYRSETTTSDG